MLTGLALVNQLGARRGTAQHVPAEWPDASLASPGAPNRSSRCRDRVPEPDQLRVPAGRETLGVVDTRPRLSLAASLTVGRGVGVPMPWAWVVRPATALSAPSWAVARLPPHRSRVYRLPPAELGATAGRRDRARAPSRTPGGRPVGPRAWAPGAPGRRPGPDAGPSSPGGPRPRRRPPARGPLR